MILKQDAKFSISFYPLIGMTCVEKKLSLHVHYASQGLSMRFPNPPSFLATMCLLLAASTILDEKKYSDTSCLS